MKIVPFSEALRFLEDGCGIAIDGQFCEYRVCWAIDNNHLRIDYRDALLIFEEGLNQSVHIEEYHMLLIDDCGHPWRIISIGMRKYK